MKATDWNWREIDLPALRAVLSTGNAQPVPRTRWPSWMRDNPQFTGAWLYPLSNSPAASTATLSTGQANAYVDAERTASQPPELRYYRYVYVETADGRVFQAGPIKELEYERHRNQRPPWLGTVAPSN